MRSDGLPGDPYDQQTALFAGADQFLFAAPGGSVLAAAAAPGGSGLDRFDGWASARPPWAGGGGGGEEEEPVDSGSVLSEYRSGAEDGEANYDIWIEFKGSWTAALQDAFVQAADFFTQVITDDIGGGGRWRGKTIDDLYVSAELKAIDGPGGVLGQAGPQAVWTSNDLTAAGMMEFDSADAEVYYAKGLWDDIVTHELMHVLGFGSLWNYGDHIGLVVNGTQYTGNAALTVYEQAYSGAQFIPVEDSGGSGTAGAHWDEGALGSELMTGYINDDGDPYDPTDNYLSEFSVMALADLGYAVTYQDYPYDDPLTA